MKFTLKEKHFKEQILDLAIKGRISNFEASRVLFYLGNRFKKIEGATITYEDLIKAKKIRDNFLAKKVKGVKYGSCIKRI